MKKSSVLGMLLSAMTLALSLPACSPGADAPTGACARDADCGYGHCLEGMCDDVACGEGDPPCPAGWACDVGSGNSILGFSSSAAMCSLPCTPNDSGTRGTCPASFSCTQTMDESVANACSWDPMASAGPPVVTITPAKPLFQPNVPLHIHADASSPNGAVTSIVWDFGDGTQGKGADVVHTYTDAMLAYDGTVTATDVTETQGSTSFFVGMCVKAPCQ